MSDRTNPDDSALADALEDFHRRRGRGEVPEVEDYCDELGDSHPDFRAIVEAERLLDEVIAPSVWESLPRPFGPYTLLRELGRGAAGVVYEAVHRELGRKVALKVLRTGFDTDSTARERFRREARACAHVRHDGIVAIYEVGEVDGRPYYAMDFVPGESLAQRVRSDRPLAPETVALGLAGIADALQALHDAGIVHRDVKPSNVIVRPDGRMILADFGLARSAETATLTKTGDALGTPLYMSPEQVLGQRAEVDARTDVYGLGATFYEALTGRPVFEADELSALMKSILTERPVPPREARPSVPEAAERIALKCLEKDKKDRYPTAIALAADLRAFASGKRVVGGPVPTVVRALRAVRRCWIPIAAVIVLGAGVATWWYSRPTKLVVFSRFPDVTKIFVDGKFVGTTAGAPLEVAVSPGWHKVRYEADGMDPATDEFEFERGGKIPTKVLLFPTRGNSTGVAKFRARFHVDPPDALDAADFVESDRAVSLTLLRSPGGLAVLPIFPRGDVRLADLDVFVTNVDVDTPSDGRIVFRRGDEVLGAVERFAPIHLRAWTPVPPAMRERLAVGSVVTWGWEPASKKTFPKDLAPASATFRVVADPDLAADFARFDELRDGLDKTLLRVQLLRTRGLETAAFREAYALSRTAGREPRVWATLWRILEGWDLRASEFYGEIRILAQHGYDPGQGPLPTLEPLPPEESPPEGGGK